MKALVGFGEKILGVKYRQSSWEKRHIFLYTVSFYTKTVSCLLKRTVHNGIKHLGRPNLQKCWVCISIVLCNLMVQIKQACSESGLLANHGPWTDFKQPVACLPKYAVYKQMFAV